MQETISGFEWFRPFGSSTEVLYQATQVRSEPQTLNLEPSTVAPFMDVRNGTPSGPTLWPPRTLGKVVDLAWILKKSMEVASPASKWRL